METPNQFINFIWSIVVKKDNLKNIKMLRKLMVFLWELSFVVLHISKRLLVSLRQITQPYHLVLLHKKICQLIFKKNLMFWKCMTLTLVNLKLDLVLLSVKIECTTDHVGLSTINKFGWLVFKLITSWTKYLDTTILISSKLLKLISDLF